ncbi:MAG: hypothetical protein Q4B91_03450 [Atopobiaceae bacterium]|nr:hypothetical protein [Atopobiaceae bacterium]
MAAREFFEAVRAASADARRARAELEALEERRLSLGGHGASPVSGTRSDVNGTSASIALVDREVVLHRRVEEDYALLDRACEVIYGVDNDHGIERGMGTHFADVVWHRACGEESWDEVAVSVGMSRRTCVRYYEAAMDYVDSVGLVGSIDGAEV